MHAAVATRFTEPLTIEDRAIPTPGPGQVLIRLEACGLCHTDIHAVRGDWPVKPGLPFVPGHEGVGIVERLGEGVTTRTIGQRVALPWLGHACGECRYCIDGRENLCESQHNTGYSFDGGYAEYALADAKFATPVPDRIPPLEAAPLTCAGVTTYAAVKAAHVVPGERVAVFGIGGLGHLAVQYARLVGAQAIAVDVRRDKLDLALELGADHAINAAEVDPVEAIAELGGADVTIVLAVDPVVFDQAFRALNRGGRMLLVSLPAEGVLTVPISDTVLKGISIIGSIVGTRQDLVEVFALHAAGRTRVVAEERELRDVNQAMKEVVSGAVPARLVFTYDSALPVETAETTEPSRR
jgi:propanol-preferring alcohol dehydrogenase